jgi:hypothetical protein
LCAKGWREGRWSRTNIYLNADHFSVFETTFALPLIILFKNYPNHVIYWVQNFIFVKEKVYWLNNWYKRQKLSMITNVDSDKKHTLNIFLTVLNVYNTLVLSILHALITKQQLLFTFYKDSNLFVSLATCHRQIFL